MLELSHLGRRYGPAVALSDISLTLAPGRVLAVLGPSGCGKSTLLKLISGLEEPDSGEVRINGQLIAKPGFSLPPEKRPINMVFQDYALWPHMNVRRIVGYGLTALSRVERRQRVDELLALLHLEDYGDRLPSQLSGGQQQRVAIARALATDPEVLLFDEPLSNLDVQLRMEMRFELADLFERLNKTVLYVTHDPLEACAFADELLVLKEGYLEQAGPVRTLFAQPASPWVAGLAGFDSRLTAWLEHPLDEQTWQVAVNGQRLACCLTQDAQSVAGEPVSLMLHSGSIRLCSQDEAAQPNTNYLSGTVRQCLFEGHQWRLRLDLGGTLLSLTSEQPHERGAALHVAFPYHSALAFT
ncbi:ABC transporter ATP-binding protein [Vreelandella sp. EE27]